METEFPKLFQSKHWFLKPQADFICDEKGKTLVNFVGRLENIERDFRNIAKHSRLASPTLPRRNLSKKQNLGKNLDPILLNNYNRKSIDLVDELYKKDFDIFYRAERKML